jgi:hypothetical protein
MGNMLKKRNIRFIFLTSFLFGCSEHQMSSINNFNKIENNITILTLDNLKNNASNSYWQIYIKDNNLELYDILSKLETIKINNNFNKNIDFYIESEIEQEIFGEKTLFSGTINIKSQKFSGFEEKIIFTNWEDIKIYLEKFFLSKKNYILEKRVNRDGDAIFKISLGKKDNIKIGDRVGIYIPKLIINHLNGETHEKLYKIGVGKVSLLKNNYSWIIATSNINNKINIGAIIKLYGKRDFGSYLEDGKDFFKINDNILDRKIKFLLPFGD